MDPIFDDFTIGNGDLLFLNPCTLDVVHGLSGLGNAVLNRFFETDIGFGADLDDFSNVHTMSSGNAIRPPTEQPAR